MDKLFTMTRIGFYVGSFDPFHIGHLEVAEVALKFVDKVIIIPNNPNNNKPYRSNLKYRVEIIKLSISHNENIIVTEQDVNIINSDLYENNHLVGLIGSDQCNKEPKSKVHEWLVVPRNNHEIPEIKWSVPVTILPSNLFKSQQWSSTAIRRHLSYNNDDDIPVCNTKVKKYINDLSLYSLMDYARKRKIQGGIQKIKDSVFIINNIIIKSFPNVQAFIYEQEAYKIAKELSLPIAEYLFDEDDIIMGISYVGISVGNAILEGYSPYDAGYKVGVLLKKLHTTVITSDVSVKTIMDNRKIKNIIDGGLLSDNQELIEKYSQNPGSLGFCHGDASINNFTLLNDEIFMIDFSGLSKMKSYGIPAYEYYQFITSCRSLSNMESDTVYKLVLGFFTGYGKTGFTVEANKLFTTYWNRMLANSRKKI